MIYTKIFQSLNIKSEIRPNIISEVTAAHNCSNHKHSAGIIGDLLRMCYMDTN